MAAAAAGLIATCTWSVLTSTSVPSPHRLSSALDARAPLLQRLHDERTDAYRLLTPAEGVDGVTVDRYAGALFVQSFRAPLVGADGAGGAEEAEACDALIALAEHAASHLRLERVPRVIVSHRGGGISRRGAQDRTYASLQARLDEAQEGTAADAGTDDAQAAQPMLVQEHGLLFESALHAGRDPGIYLDFRAGRRWVREEVAARAAAGESVDVLNLFAYTCTAGVCAAAAGARVATNVDVSRTSLDAGARNAGRNGLPEGRVENLVGDVLPVTRALAGLPVAADRRRTQRSRARRHAPAAAALPARRQYHVAVLDPPTFASSPFGAVDIVRDYQSLLKPALLALAEGGALLATNHAADVELDAWLDACERCARKAGRPLACAPEVVEPDSDFPPAPSARPGDAHLLKMAVLRV